jgi:galactose oxidase
MKDPNRNVGGENYWTHAGDIADAEDYCCPTASLTELGANGKTVSHKVVMFSSKEGPNGNLPSKAVQMIDYASAAPVWEPQGDLIQTASFYKAVVLPDGKVLVTSGKDGTRPLQNYEERNVLPVQLFDPATGQVTKLAKTTVSRGLHGNALLLPDATVMIMGDDRINLVPPGDRAYPAGDPDQGVANGQIFRPPYLFSGPEQEAVRPVILDAPDEISYRGHFDVKVDGLASRIKSVSIIRTDFDTHSLESGEKYVKLAFSVKGKDADGRLRLESPEVPAQALQGDYMLFVLDAAGVPSVAKHVRLKIDNQGQGVR